MILKGIQSFSEEALYDDIGPAYEEAFANLGPQIASIEWLKTQLKGQEPARILDIGCGTGRPVCSELANADHDVLGVELSTKMVEYAREKVPNAKFEKADICHYDPSPVKFDAITAYFSLTGGISQGQIIETIGKIFHWLKPGGFFIFATLPVEVDNEEDQWMGRHCVYSSFSEARVLEIVQQKGFKILHHSTTQFMPDSVKAGLCKADEVREETHLFLYAKRP